MVRFAGPPDDRRIFVSPRSASNGRRPGAFLFSAAFHGTLLALVAFGPSSSPRSKRPIFDTIIRPNEKRIIWYRKLPEIAPVTKVGNSKEPRGVVKSPTTTIAMSPQAKSLRQLVLQNSPQIKLDVDLSAPNLVALAAAAPPPPPEPKKTKRFVAPPVPVKPRAPDPVLTELDVKLNWVDDAGVQRSLALMRPKKTFVAPPRKEAPKLPVPEPVLDEPPEVGSAGAAQVARLPGMTTQNKPPPRRFTPPSERKASGAHGAGGSGGDGVLLETPAALPSGSKLSAAIVGLNPSDNLNYPIPPGNRPAEFSAAPSIGKTSTGDVNGAGGPTVPGLMVKGGKSEPTNGKSGAVAAVPGTRIVMYDDMVPSSIRPALSAALRPASRTIPLALEARFRGRLVYAIVIPAPNLPAYTGDWIVWFAPEAQKPGEGTLVRAPVPFRKTEPTTSKAASSDRSEARVQLAAIIKPNGQFDSITVVRSPTAPLSQGAIEDLKRWEFRPALRDGSAIGVEVVIEIPFNVAWLNGSL